MKNIALIMVITFSATYYSKAQSYSYFAFPDSNPDWYTYAYITPEGNCMDYRTHYYYTGDTVVHRFTYHKLAGWGLLRSDSLKRTYFHYDSNALAWGIQDTLEHIIYDFALNEGDTLFDSIQIQAPGYTSYNTVVDSIRYVLINNSYRRKFYVGRWCIAFADGNIFRHGYRNGMLWFDGGRCCGGSIYFFGQ